MYDQCVLIFAPRENWLVYVCVQQSQAELQSQIVRMQSQIQTLMQSVNTLSQQLGQPAGKSAQPVAAGQAPPAPEAPKPADTAPAAPAQSRIQTELLFLVVEQKYEQALSKVCVLWSAWCLVLSA